MNKFVRCLYCGKILAKSEARKSTEVEEDLFAHESCVKIYDKQVRNK